MAQSYSIIRIKMAKALKMLQKSVDFNEFRSFYGATNQGVQFVRL
jgi:hypothetical protein